MKYAIWFVTTNKGKIDSMERHLNPLGITVHAVNREIKEIQVDDIRMVARQKSEEAFRTLPHPRPVIAMDAGIAIPSLGGFPGAYTKYVLEKLGPVRIARLVDKEDARCEMQHVISFVPRTPRNDLGQPDLEAHDFYTRVKGRLVREPRGELASHHWSSLALVFIPDGYDKTLAELTKEEYQDLSRQHSVSKKFADWLRDNPDELEALEQTEVL